MHEVRQMRKPVQPITKMALEIIRIRVTTACLITAVEDNERKQPVRHLWFPEDNVNRYELRLGNPPADSDRPRHLRGLQLVIDIRDIPQDVWDEMKRSRKEAKSATAAPTSMGRVMTDQRYIASAMRNLHKGKLLVH